MSKVEENSKWFPRFTKIHYDELHIYYFEQRFGCPVRNHVPHEKPLHISYFWKPGFIFPSVELKIIEHLYLYIPTISGAKIDTLEHLIRLVKCKVNFFEDFRRVK